MPPRTAALLALLIAAGSVAGCAPEPSPGPSAGASATATAKPTPTTTPTPTPTPTPAQAVAPLRGTTVLAATVAGPALAAKIDNHRGARPQWGLERADLVFEELVEGGITRYVAVWQSDVPARVGPLRSIRPMDPDIIAPLGGIVAYSGGKRIFVDMMKSTSVHNAIHGGADDRFMYRSRDKLAPHNVVVKAQDLRAKYASIPPPPQQFRYAASARYSTAAMFGAAAAGVDARFSGGSVRTWRWDAASAAFLRGQDGRRDLDAKGDQLRATNVVLLSVEIDWRYGYIPKTVLVGSGRAWVAGDGKVVEATWSKASRTAPIVLQRTDGMPLYLAQGSTWIELVPTRGAIVVVP